MKWILLVLSLNAASAWAQSPTPKIPTVVEVDVLTPKKKRFVLDERRYWAMMAAGLDFRSERDQDQNLGLANAPALSIGLGYQRFLGVMEYARFEGEKDGNTTLFLRRASETAMAWGHYYTDDEWKFRPFFGLGLGARREQVTTTFSQDQREDRSRWNEMLGGSFGFRWAGLAPIWLTLEGRVLFSRDLDPSPALGGIVKIGFVLE